MLWARYALLTGRWSRSFYSVTFDHLESPGTKTYSDEETRRLFSRFTDATLERRLSPGDLLFNAPSERFRGSVYKLAWGLYPRRLVRAIGDRFGLFVLIRARKPQMEVVR
jgi:hypothetical protein